MAAAGRLRAVEDGGTVPMGEGSISRAVEGGSSKDVLLTLRRRLARALDDEATPPRDLASLSRRLLEVDEQIRTIDLAEAERQRQEGSEATEDEDGLGDV